MLLLVMLLLIQLFRILTVAAGDSALVSIIITGSSDPNLGDSALCSSSGADLEFSSKLADASEEIFFVFTYFERPETIPESNSLFLFCVF